jgi:hypothetical protein
MAVAVVGLPLLRALVEGASGDGLYEVGWWTIGGVELRQNMTSMLGRNAAPRGVERKSAGGFNFVNIRLAALAMVGLEATRKRNAPLTHDA